MNKDKISLCVELYEQHKNLKIVGELSGIPWQTVYVYLKGAGVPVTGDKERYGSHSDRFAARSERDFLSLVPFAEDLNRRQFQSKFDFDVYGFKVDVKASQLKRSSKRCAAKRYSFSIKRQEVNADFFVLLGYKDDCIDKCYLIPAEIVRYMTTISISENGGKWASYEIDKNGLAEFFEGMREAVAV